MPVGVFLSKLDRSCFNRQDTALGHCISGVDHEVHQHLFDLTGIGLNSFKRQIEFGGELNIFANQSPQHLVHIRDHVIKIDRQRLQNLLAAESQQLPSKIGSAIPSLLNLFEVTPERVIVVD